uniref:Uncharacterized protein n=1 Tax=Timema tahoe TaxID=61484 RepID=A0A7R9IQG7_9NEOP|nr:unnamed protein product [Timema tahoe]
MHAMPTKEDSGDWFGEEMSNDERKGIEKNERDREVVEKEMGTKKDEVEVFKGKKDNVQKRQRGSENEKPNHVLLFTVINPVYPITVVSTFLLISWGHTC